jgi:xanthine dehydrogenase accessory factor
MSFDRQALVHAVKSGPVARILVTEAKGSVPRNAGTSMLVASGGQTGTIGGGALEWEAVRIAREVLTSRRDRLVKMPLGPNLGQCCGGAVTLLIEVWDTERLDAVGDGPVIARPLPEGPREMPPAVALGLDRIHAITMRDGWILEPADHAATRLWLWGAGHVGRAIAAVMAPLPQVALTWIDTASDRFPDDLPEGVDKVVAANPTDLVQHAPRDAHHLILTYSHDLDLKLCHALLSRGFASCGLIGSRTKWARFRSRLQALGHAPAEIGRITCPIGDPALGKHPQAIALGVAVAILHHRERGEIMDLSA